MNAAAIPSHILSELQWRQEHDVEMLGTGLHELDAAIEGCPRGRITAISGPVSSGRTSLLHSILAEASRLGEYCAVIDTMNSFDPASASEAGVNLGRILWIRCGGHPDHAIKAADLLAHAGGFGLIALDLCEAPARLTRHIPISWWYRFRRAIENTPTVFIVLETEPSAKGCASLFLEMKRDHTEFTGTRPFQYLDRAQFQAMPRKPMRPTPSRFEAHALR